MMKQYFISGIWTSIVKGQTVVTHVMLHHSDDDKKFKAGKKVHQDTVIKLIRNNALIYTIEWSYKFQEWQKGTPVSIEQSNETEYLTTKREGQFNNNLATLLPMKVLTAKPKEKDLVDL